MPPIPVETDDLTPAWLTHALGRDVTGVEVVDRHSGTTGRVQLRLTGAPDVPSTVFVKLPPFDETQRRFVNAIGMGVTEARFYRDLAAEVPVRVPGVWFADFDDRDGYVMVLEDLTATGCGFPTPDDAHLEARARDVVQQLAALHARYWESERFARHGDLAWIAPKTTGSGDGGASMVRSALDRLADRLPDGFVPLAELYVARSSDVLPLYRQGPCTLVHGDPHLGNLFVDGDGRRTGFFDWAMLARAPGVRDVAYVLCNSIPAAIRRATERDLVREYCDAVGLDHDVGWDQYRLFAVYSWVSATCTLAMGSKWQPERVGLGGTTRATIAARDLDCVGLLRDRLT